MVGRVSLLNGLGVRERDLAGVGKRGLARREVQRLVHIVFGGWSIQITITFDTRLVLLIFIAPVFILTDVFP